MTVYADPLVAENDSFEGLHDRDLNGDVSENDFNWNGNALTATVVAGPASGTLTFNSDGTFTYSPPASFVGDTQFTYELDDGTNTSNIATVSLSIENTQPELLDQFFLGSHDQTLNVAAPGLLARAHDEDQDALTIQLEQDVTSGSLTINADGSFSYTPNASFLGDDTFSISVSDGLAASDPVQVTLRIENSDPESADDVYRIQHSETLNVTTADGVLANDFDADADVLAIELLSDVSHGTLTLNSDGSFDYVNTNPTVAEDQFTYRLNDGLADSEEATVTLQIENATPWVVSDSYHVTHDQSLLVDVASGLLSNDYDDDDDPMTAVLVDDVVNGTLTLAADGSFTYVPNSGFFGPDSFTYLADDTADQSEVVTVDIEVINQAPEAQDDSFTIQRNDTIVVAAPGVMANDLEFDADPVTLFLVSDVENGTLTLNGDGSFTYVPDSTFAGVDTFTYELNDGLTTSELATVEIEVRNAAPEASGDWYPLTHDQTLVVGGTGILADDVDGNQDVLSTVLIDDVSHGALTLNSDGSFTYTPTAGFVGLDRFRYQASDGIDGSNTVSVDIDVENGRPWVFQQRHRVVHDTTLVIDEDSGLLATANDPDGDTLSLALVNDVSHGSLTLNADGSFDYQPNAGFVGSDSFTVQVSDSLLTSKTATVNIDVVNSAPVAVSDQYLATKDQDLSVVAPGLLQNDVDFDAEDLDIVLRDDPHFGTVTIAVDGSFTYTPDSEFVGFDKFTYEITDGHQTDRATVHVEVTGAGSPASDTPATHNDNYEVSHGQTLLVGFGSGVLANDADPNGDWLSVELVAGPQDGTLTLNDDGSFEYETENDTFIGSATFTYKASDGENESAVTTVTVDVTNAAPTISNSAYSVHQGDTLLGSYPSLLSTVSDADGDEPTVALVSYSGNGSVSVQGDGSFTYTAEAGFVGIDSFTIKANDGLQDSGSATITVDVTNESPRGDNDQFVVQHGESLTVAGPGLAANGTDKDGDELTVELVSNPTNGTLSLSSSGSFSYFPNGGFSGHDLFEYRLNDGAENSPTYSVDIEVLNSDPVADDMTLEVHQGTTLSRQADSYDADGDALSPTVDGQGSNGTASVDASGNLSYVPDAGFVGEDSFTYTVTDNLGTSEEATVTVNVTNLAPVALSATYWTRPTQGISMGAPGLLELASDVDGDQLQISDSSVTTSPLQLNHGELVVNSDGSFTYTPNGDSAGRDTFSFQVSDGAEDSEPAIVDLIVMNEVAYLQDRQFEYHYATGAIDANDSSKRNFTFQLLNGEDRVVRDPNGDPLTPIITTAAEAGVVTVDSLGLVTFQVDRNYLGTVSFDYKVHDGFEDSNEARVDLTISNKAPSAGDNWFSITSSETLTIEAERLLSNDSDVNGDQITITSVSSPSNGTLTFDAAENAWTFDPQGFAGIATFTYVVNDGLEDSNLATVYIESVDLDPRTIGDFYQIRVDDLLTVDSLSARNAVWDGQGATAEVVSGPSLGVLTFDDDDGSFVYDPNVVGLDVFTFKVIDGNGESDPVEVWIENLPILQISVNHEQSEFGGFTAGGSNPTHFGYTGATIVSQNTAPVASNDGVYEVLHGTVIVPGDVNAPDLLVNDYDPDGDALTISVITGPTSGTLDLLGGGEFRYTPGAVGQYDFVGSDSFTYKITDAAGFTDTATAHVNFTNQSPILGIHEQYFESPAGSYMIDLPVSDPDGDTLTYTNVAVDVGTLDPQQGQPARYTFLPPGGDPNWTGDATLTFTATDTAGAAASSQLVIKVRTAANMPDLSVVPLQAFDDRFEWIGGTLTGTVLGNDLGSDSPLTVTSGSSGLLSIETDGTFTFSVAAGMERTFNGQSVTYTVQDNAGNSDTAILTIDPFELEAGESVNYGAVTVANGERKQDKTVTCLAIY